MGSDVAALNDLLAAQQLPHTPGEDFTAETADGVREFSESIGATETTFFDPNWVVFLPAPQVLVAESEIWVGAPVPAPGSVLFTGAPPLAQALLVRAASVAPDTADTADGGSSAPTDPGEIVVAPEQATLYVGEVAVELDPARDRVAPGALERLEGLSQPDSSLVTGQLRIPPGPDEFVVPAAAVFVSADGQTCVLRRRAGIEAGIAVAVVGGTFDRNVVRGDLAPGEEVALSPPTDQRRCG